MKNLIFAVFCILSACGSEGNINVKNDYLTNENNVVVVGRAYIEFSSGINPKSNSNTLSTSSNVNVSGVNAASTTFTLDTTGFVVPTLDNSLLPFGFISVSALQDNNLNVCGVGSNQHCGTAFIRVYTTGTAAAGFYNTVDSYGAPVHASQTNPPTQVVGLSSANSALMQTITVATSKHSLKLSDFTNPKYFVNVDMTDAGTGSYSTTLVVELALSP